MSTFWCSEKQIGEKRVLEVNRSAGYTFMGQLIYMVKLSTDIVYMTDISRGVDYCFPCPLNKEEVLRRYDTNRYDNDTTIGRPTTMEEHHEIRKFREELAEYLKSKFDEITRVI